MSTALIIANDQPTLQVLRIAFTARGYQLLTALDERAALRLVSQSRPQVIVLDTETSTMDSRGVVVAIRDLTTAPIIALSADPDGAVRVLDAGADDYLAKPFGIEELLARVRAAMRRAAPVRGDQRRGIVDAGTFTMDLDAKKVWRDGIEVHLSPTEWNVLEILVRNEGRLVTQRYLLTTIWGPDHYADTHYLRVYIGQLRRKLEPHPAQPRHLITEPNRGYRFHTHRTDRQSP